MRMESDLVCVIGFCVLEGCVKAELDEAADPRAEDLQAQFFLPITLRGDGKWMDKGGRAVLAQGPGSHKLLGDKVDVVELLGVVPLVAHRPQHLHLPGFKRGTSFRTHQDKEQVRM